MGEKLLFADYPLLLNIGGIANISYRNDEQYIAFDVCAANRVLNMLASLAGKKYDEDGQLAAEGELLDDVLQELNELEYYKRTFPKSLDNQFGIDEVFPMLPKDNIADALTTYVEHIALQVRNAVQSCGLSSANRQLLMTGGGAHNSFLVDRIRHHLSSLNIDVVVPERNIVDYKEALIMGLLGVLRWREQNTTLSSVTGAKRDSIGGAVWIGQEA
jgi:anhydro-N-acetylmuramic acid kinase